VKEFDSRSSTFHCRLYFNNWHRPILVHNHCGNFCTYEIYARPIPIYVALFIFTWDCHKNPIYIGFPTPMHTSNAYATLTATRLWLMTPWKVGISTFVRIALQHAASVVDRTDDVYAEQKININERTALLWTNFMRGEICHSDVHRKPRAHKKPTLFQIYHANVYFSTNIKN